MKGMIIHILFFFSGISVFSVAAQEEVLESYIQIGLENNLALSQKTGNWEQSHYALKEAKGLFYPEISLNARYTIADGGRVIDFPVGDMLNPVYSSLNSLTGTSNFPQIENMQFPFLRPTEHETKIRLVQAVFNSDIYYNQKIHENSSDAIKADMNSYKRSLVSEIKQAYYEYIKMTELNRLLAETRKILEENLRVNQKLYENQKATKDIVLRSETEILGIDEKQASVNKGVRVSAAYFNFLLNRDLDAEILVSGPGEVDIAAEPEILMDEAIKLREEITGLDSYIRMAENNLKLNNASKFPDLFAVVDYGFQGEEYSFTNKDDYIMASLVFQWDIFKGFQNKNKINQARINLEQLHRKREEVIRLIRLEILGDWYELIEVSERLKTAQSRVLAEREVFRIIEKKYLEGQANQLEYLNARNSLTSSEQQVIITKYDLMISGAKLEKATAGYQFIQNDTN